MPGLPDLPPELVLEIAKRLPEQTHGNPSSRSMFSRTCRDIHTIVEPEIFRSITISANPFLAVKGILTTYRQFHYVKELTVHAAAAQWSSDESWKHNFEDEAGFVEDQARWDTLVDPLSAVLRGDPKHGGSLRKLTLILPKHYRHYCHRNGWGCIHHTWAICQKTLLRIDVLLRAASLNSTITDLVIKNLPPYDSPIFETTEWRSFMSRLKTLDIELFNEEGLEHHDYFSQAPPTVPDFVTRFTGAGLVKNFLPHTSSLNKLRIYAHDEFVEDHVFEDRKAYDEFVERFANVTNDEIWDVLPELAYLDED